MLFWYLRISRRATVPALYLAGFAAAIGSPAAPIQTHQHAIHTLCTRSWHTVASNSIDQPPFPSPSPLSFPQTRGMQKRYSRLDLPATLARFLGAFFATGVSTSTCLPAAAPPPSAWPAILRATVPTFCPPEVLDLDGLDGVLAMA